MDKNPKYPIFIPTKNRYDTRYTIKSFENINVPYKIVIEPQDYDNYSQYIKEENIIVLPHRDKGLVITRNWIWDYAASLNVPYFWTFDDNIKDFYRFHKNKRIRLNDGSFLRIIEEFAERFENLAITGMHYIFFANTSLTNKIKKPILLNSRIYSNMLIKTDIKNPDGIPYRNRGFYNDDTDLCLQVLKDGWCTVLFYAFLIGKQQTMTIKGGMTPFYQDDGRYKMAKELRDRHPDVVRLTRKWGRWQHQVDYRPFKGNRLILKDGIEIPQGINNFGMKLIKKEDGKTL